MLKTRAESSCTFSAGRRDVFVSLPTGYGMSAIFKVLPFCASCLVSLVNPNPESVAVVLIFSPLVADQVARLKDKTHGSNCMDMDQVARLQDKLQTTTDPGQ